MYCNNLHTFCLAVLTEEEMGSYLQKVVGDIFNKIIMTVSFDMSLMESLLFLCSDLEKHIVAEDEKLYLKEKGVNTDEIQGICE